MSTKKNHTSPRNWSYTRVSENRKNNPIDQFLRNLKTGNSLRNSILFYCSKNFLLKNGKLWRLKYETTFIWLLANLWWKIKKNDILFFLEFSEILRVISRKYDRIIFDLRLLNRTDKCKLLLSKINIYLIMCKVFRSIYFIDNVCGNDNYAHISS